MDDIDMVSLLMYGFAFMVIMAVLGYVRVRVSNIKMKRIALIIRDIIDVQLK